MKLPDKLYAMLGFATKSGNVVMGVTSVIKSIEKSKVLLVLMDASVAEHTKQKIIKACEKGKVFLIEAEPEGELGARVGKMGIMVVGIVNKMFANRIKEIYNEHVLSAEV